MMGAMPNEASTLFFQCVHPHCSTAEVTVGDLPPMPGRAQRVPKAQLDPSPRPASSGPSWGGRASHGTRHSCGPPPTGQAPLTGSPVSRQPSQQLPLTPLPLFALETTVAALPLQQTQKWMAPSLRRRPWLPSLSARDGTCSGQYWCKTAETSAIRVS